MENRFISDLIARYPSLEKCKPDILSALEILKSTYYNGAKILVCGNGGSSADSDHIAGELLKGFLSKRPMTNDEKALFENALGKDAEKYVAALQRGVPVISLPSQSAPLTAFANDVEAQLMYAQLVFAYARGGDALLAISTSGNSKNVVCAAETAKALGIKTIALTGAKDSRLSSICDVTIKAPEEETFKIQELHLPIYHCLCAALEEELFV
ncbi:MAG: SIS domain-containing protein [Clostridia bacterium]|nr:SIS domain-containing protein [Clostridia bacterium]